MKHRYRPRLTPRRTQLHPREVHAVVVKGTLYVSRAMFDKLKSEAVPSAIAGVVPGMALAVAGWLPYSPREVTSRERRRERWAKMREERERRRYFDYRMFQWYGRQNVYSNL